MIKVICLFGESGSGKDRLLNELVGRYPQTLNKIISYTSRPPRGGEKNGIDYFFISKEQFSQKIKDNEMLEYTHFNNWYYGTAKSNLSIDKINIGVFNPTGVDSLFKNKELDLRIFYIYTPDKLRIIRQLNREENPDIDEIIRRFSTDRIDFQFIESRFPYIKLNNIILEDCIRDIAELCRLED